jgi:hypothetical protein
MFMIIDKKDAKKGVIIHEMSITIIKFKFTFILFITPIPMAAPIRLLDIGTGK